MCLKQLCWKQLYKQQLILHYHSLRLLHQKNSQKFTLVIPEKLETKKELLDFSEKVNLSNLPNLRKNINKLIKKYKVPDIMVNCTYPFLCQKKQRFTLMLIELLRNLKF